MDSQNPLFPNYHLSAGTGGSPVLFVDKLEKETAKLVHRITNKKLLSIKFRRTGQPSTKNFIFKPRPIARGDRDTIREIPSGRGVMMGRYSAQLSGRGLRLVCGSAENCGARGSFRSAGWQVGR